MNTMTQCTLTKGMQTQTTWIPSAVARLGATIKLKENGSWSEGWIVQRIGNTISEKFVKDRQKSINRIMNGKSFNNI